MDLREIGWGRMNRIHLAPDRDQCRALVNTAITLGVHKIGNIMSGRATSASQEELSSMELVS
jgi:hypothetical protein